VGAILIIAVVSCRFILSSIRSRLSQGGGESDPVATQAAAQLESLPADQREKNMALQVTITKIISYFVSAIALICTRSSLGFCF